MNDPNPPRDPEPSRRLSALTGAAFVAAFTMLLASALLAFYKADTAAVVTMIIGAVLLILLFPYGIRRQQRWKKRWTGAFSPYGRSGAERSSQTHVKM
jgi:O-antigen/teichoic acid export membrane protein